MSDQTSARLGLPYLAAGQLQKHVTLNESLTRLDALVQTAVQSRALSTPPAEAAEGALFILAEPGAGDWAGRPVGALMRRDMGGWVEVAPVPGQIVFVLDAAEIVVRGETEWALFSGGGGGGGGGEVGPELTVERLGVGAEADAVNPFSAKLNKALWAARGAEEGGDGDLRFTFSKAGPDDVLSLLFQSGFAGRAEIGLVGDDDLKLKVSADGSTWRDVFSVDRTTGQAAFVRGAARMETHVISASGGFTPPSWVRWIEATAIGGGGGGGWGHSDAPGATRFGGGGGGGGGVARLRLPVSELNGQPLSVSVGAGGAGGTASGQPGASGGVSSLSISGTVLVSAPGGSGGFAGTAGAGVGGAGGPGGGAGGVSAAASVAGSGGDGGEPDCPGGGGAGGGLDGANVPRSGGAGGAGARLGVTAAGGAASSSLPGASGQIASRAVLSAAGGGGGGGSAANSGAGRAGGAGALYGAGGGGGGAGMSTGGAGGAGAGGAVRLTVIG